jgi:hypothetical protein
MNFLVIIDFEADTIFVNDDEFVISEMSEREFMNKLREAEKMGATFQTY